jgi:hypothetical protein
MENISDPAYEIRIEFDNQGKIVESLTRHLVIDGFEQSDVSRYDMIMHILPGLEEVNMRRIRQEELKKIGQLTTPPIIYANGLRARHYIGGKRPEG